MLSFCSFLFLLLFVTPSKLVKKIFQYCKLAILFRELLKWEMPISLKHLPQELVSNILSRLPAKELLKCKCVCKSWFKIIADPQFVANYYSLYNNPSHQEKHLLVIQRPLISSNKTSLSFLSLSFKDPEKHISSSLLNLPEEYNSEHKYWSEIMGPCNGIYFLEGNPNLMMNPSLTQFKALPESRLIDLSRATYYSLENYTGFGFDPKTDDYKVVVLKDMWLKETDERKSGHWRAELYMLNSNKWSKVDDSALPLPIEICGSSSRIYTYVNNCYHWWGFTNEFGKREDIVVSFDMVSEVFRKIKVPKVRESSEESFTMLTPFEKSDNIGAIVYPSWHNVKRFDVWVMKDYWDEGSWIKYYSVGPSEVVERVMGFIGTYCFLWRCTDEGLVLHDVESLKTTVLKVLGNRNGSFRAAIYKQSLVSLLK